MRSRKLSLLTAGAAALLWAAGRVALAQHLPAAAAAAAPSSAAGAMSEASSIAAANETVLMTLAVAAVVLVAGLLTRMLLRLGIVRSYAWMLPVLTVASGALWGASTSMHRPDWPRLRAMAMFLFTFCAFLCLLVVVARAAMPSQVRRTRAAVPPLIRRLAVLVCAFLGFFILLTWSFPGLNLTPVFVTSGALSIVVGLAVQDLLHNVLAGVVLSTERPFKVGDWVRAGDVEGEVGEIGWRVTRLVTRENDAVEIPNRVMIGEKLMNYDAPSHIHVRRIRVGVTYETPPALAVNALLEAASRVPSALKSPAPIVHFMDYADSSLHYELRVYIDNYASAPAIDSDLRKEIWYAFKRHGITIPFPQRDVHLFPAPEETRARARPTGRRRRAARGLRLRAGRAAHHHRPRPGQPPLHRQPARLRPARRHRAPGRRQLPHPRPAQPPGHEGQRTEDRFLRSAPRGPDRDRPRSPRLRDREGNPGGAPLDAQGQLLPPHRRPQRPPEQRRDEGPVGVGPPRQPPRLCSSGPYESSRESGPRASNSTTAPATCT